MGSMGELVCRRTLEKTETGFVPGQHQARIIDPRPHRDRGDLAAVLTYVDDDGMACSLLCLRYRDDRGWQPLTLHRAGLKRSERSTAVGAPALEGRLLETLELASDGAAPYPFEEPSPEELRMRRLAHKLIDQVERGDARG
jgi:hypothetical protein